ncbi:MAG: DUF5684 domain-containing protein [Kiritimatiellae bacterium]|jgi:hypothetical protein|nr:DUF5684 domain-containing protein [Kiritimatiellia bacterium]
MEEMTITMDPAATAAGAGIGLFTFALWVAMVVFYIIVMWKIFVKAGQPGWASIIPIYNVYVMIKIAGKPGWWLLLFFIPFVNIIIGILVLISFAEKFGKGIGFVLGLIFLSPIFYAILAFDSSEYQEIAE